MLRPGLLILCACPMAVGLAAHANPAQSDIDRETRDQSAAVSASGSGRSADMSSPLQAHRCSTVQQWDAKMQMCMPPGDKEKQAGTSDATPPHTVSVPGPDARQADRPSVSGPGPTGRSADAAMNMSLPGGTEVDPTLMFHLNQFMVYSSTSGNRGKSRLTGPGNWMLTYDRNLSPNNHLSIDVMASPEQLTVGNKGTPQLFQTEHIDDMHAHDAIMAFELRDTLAVGENDNQKLTFMFAPRGQAPIGPVPFMHRESAEGNPDAPLGHALQDGFHDASTVLGIEYQVARTSFEVTGFSGQSISWPFPLHRLDSYGVRLNQGIDDHVSVGASYADARLPDDSGGGSHNQFMSAWLTTSHGGPRGALKSSFIWAATRAGHDAVLNSFLVEAVYKQGMNRVYGRAEALQITPNQLNVTTADGTVSARWVKALTLGYERALFERDQFHLFAGGSYTVDFAPLAFRPEYGVNLRGAKLYFRASYMSNIWPL